MKHSPNINHKFIIFQIQKCGQTDSITNWMICGCCCFVRFFKKKKASIKMPKWIIYLRNAYIINLFNDFIRFIDFNFISNLFQTLCFFFILFVSRPTKHWCGFWLKLNRFMQQHKVNGCAIAYWLNFRVLFFFFFQVITSFTNEHIFMAHKNVYENRNLMLAKSIYWNSNKKKKH